MGSFRGFRFLHWHGRSQVVPAPTKRSAIAVQLPAYLCLHFDVSRFYSRIKNQSESLPLVPLAAARWSYNSRPSSQIRRDKSTFHSKHLPVSSPSFSSSSIHSSTPVHVLFLRRPLCVSGDHRAVSCLLHGPIHYLTMYSSCVCVCACVRVCVSPRACVCVSV